MSINSDLNNNLSDASLNDVICKKTIKIYLLYSKLY
jgi:hypothetical protein